MKLRQQQKKLNTKPNKLMLHLLLKKLLPSQLKVDLLKLPLPSNKTLIKSKLPSPQLPLLFLLSKKLRLRLMKMRRRLKSKKKLLKLPMSLLKTPKRSSMNN